MAVSVVKRHRVLAYGQRSLRVIDDQHETFRIRHRWSRNAKVLCQRVKVFASRRVDIAIRRHIVEAVHDAAEDVGDGARDCELIRPDLHVLACLRLVLGFDTVEQILRVQVLYKF